MSVLPENLTLKDLPAYGRDPNFVWIVTMMTRPGAAWFLRHLEVKYYRPESPRNDLFQMVLVKWPDDCEMIWAAIRLPAAEKQYLYDTAKATGMRIGDGVPTMFGGAKVQTFPLDGPNVFTLENSENSILYIGGKDQVEKIESEQIRLLDNELLAALKSEGVVAANENPFLSEKFQEESRRIKDWEES